MSSKELMCNQDNNLAHSRPLIDVLVEYATAIVLLAVCCFVPFYVSNGYFNIGDDKFHAYKQCMLYGMPILIALFVAYLIVHRADWRSVKLTTTDYFVVAYLFGVALSIISGGFLPDALSGYPGWHMGLLSQLSFGLIYLFASRFGSHYRIVLGSLFASSLIVFGIGILNRMGVDVLGFYKEIDPVYQATFVSTLGQTSWYGSFMMVVVPMGLYSLIFADKKLVRILSMVFVGISFLTMVTVNSESGYAAFAIAMLVCFCLAIKDAERCYWFLIVLDIFVLAGRLVHFYYIRKPYLYFWPDFFTQIIVLKDEMMWCVFGIVLMLTVAVYCCVKSQWWFQEYITRIMVKIALLITCLLVLTVIFLIICNTNGWLPDSVGQKIGEISYFTWQETWGNNRGKTWAFSVKMYMDYPLKYKLFGVGPDCYYDYAQKYYSQRLYEMWGNQALTNAHNEWLNMLINTGLFGVICYIGIFVSTFRACIKHAENNPILIAVAASIASYMAYNFFCYQQVLCTPFIFMLMGFGVYISERADKA